MSRPNLLSVLILILFATAAHATDHSALASRIGLNVVKVTDTARKYGGSGVFVAPGLILTGFHLISKIDEIEVTLHDGSRVSAVGIDYDYANDLALISVPVAGHPIEIANRPPRVGEEVLAIGYPFGIALAITSGHVSAVEFDFARFKGMLLLDAPINPGNSGGPLVNMQGQLAGVTMRTLDKMTNMGLVVPTARTLPLLKRNGIYGSTK